MKSLKFQISMTTLLLAGLFAPTAYGQSKSSILICRAKAKEVAKATYDDCVTIAKQDEAESIRMEYRAKIARLRDYYEQKLRRLNLKKANANAATSTSSSSESLTPAPTTEMVPAPATPATAIPAPATPAAMNTTPSMAAPAVPSTAASATVPATSPAATPALPAKTALAESTPAVVTETASALPIEATNATAKVSPTETAAPSAPAPADQTITEPVIRLKKTPGIMEKSDRIDIDPGTASI